MALTANFLTELQNTTFSANLVISIDGVYYSQYQVDSGLVIDADKLGVVDGATINGVSIDIRRASTPISEIGFKLLDKNNIISTLIGASANSLQNSEVKLYFGFRTGTFDFADYAILGTTRINGVSRQPNMYSFKSKEVTDLMQAALLNTFATLDGAITDVATSLVLTNSTGFPASGMIKLNSEFITYTGITVNTLTGLVRGVLASTPDDHEDNDIAYVVTKKEAKAIDILIDILTNDLAIDAALIDLASFTDIRDTYFSTDPDDILYLYNIPNAIKWIETRILDATNTRIFSINGKITLGILDQVPLFDDVVEINEDHILGEPRWDISSDRIVNKVIVKWDYSEGRTKFLKTSVFTDADSIAIYGPKQPLTIKLYGVFSSPIVTNRANRLLSRFSTPKASISLGTIFNRFGINVAESVRVTHRYLPQAGGTLGFSDVLEVMSKSITGLEANSRCNFKLEFSSYTGIRIGLISPNPALDLTITNQKTFEVPDGSCYKVGYALRLFNNVANVYYADPVNIIESISGNFITMTDAWVTTLGAGVSLYFADYDSSNGDQKARYAYVAPDTGIFLIDNSKAYQIIF